MTYKYLNSIVIPSTNLPDATTSSKGIIKLSGDLGGTGSTAANPTISQLTGLAGIVAVPSSSLSFGANYSTTGSLRFPNNTTIIGARNAANNADISVLATDGYNNIVYGSTLLYKQAGTLSSPIQSSALTIQPTDPAKAPFQLLISDGYFNSTMDYTFAVGYNTDLNNTDAAIYWRLEQDYEVSPGTHWFEYYIEYFGTNRGHTFRPIYLNINKSTDQGTMIFSPPGTGQTGSIQFTSADQTQNYLQILNTGFYFRNNYPVYFYDSGISARNAVQLTSANYFVYGDFGVVGNVIRGGNTSGILFETGTSNTIAVLDSALTTTLTLITNSSGASSLSWSAGTTPSYSQAQSTSGAGANTTISAQYAKAGSAAAGGNLILQAGGTDSTSNVVQEGTVQLYGGPNQIGTFSITSGASANDCRFIVGPTASYFLFSATQNNQGIIFQSYGAGSNYVAFQTPVVKFADSSLAETLDINLNATGTTSIVATAGVTAFNLGQAQSTSGAGNNLTVYGQNAKAGAATDVLGGSVVIASGSDNGITADTLHFHAPIIFQVNGSVEVARFKRDGLNENYLDFGSNTGITQASTMVFRNTAFNPMYFDGATVVHFRDTGYGDSILITLATAGANSINAYSTATSFSLGYSAAAAGAGSNISLVGQAGGTNSNGGNVVLQGGSKNGSGTDGYVILQTGSTEAARAVGATLNVTTLGLGGFIGSLPTLTTGTGAPSSSAVNGSIYLRKDGSSSTGIYTYQSGSWSPLSVGSGGISPGTAGQFLLTNSGATSSVWTTISGDISASTSTVGQLKVTSLSTSNATINAATAALTFGSNTAASGSLRFPNNTTIMAARNAANSADIPVLATDGSNNINIGDLTNTNATYISSVSSITLNAGGYSLISGSSGGLVYGGNSVYIGFNSAPNLLQFSQAATSVGINQATSTSGSGVPFTIQAQYAKAGSAAAGGNLILQAGGTDSTSNAVQEGYIQLYGGPNQIGQFSITSGASANDCRFTVGSTASYFLFAANQASQGVIFQSYGAGGNYIDFETPVINFYDNSLALTSQFTLNSSGTTSLTFAQGVGAININQTARSSDAATSSITITSQGAYTSASTNVNGAPTIIQGGAAKTNGTTGTRGGVRLQIGADTAETMLEVGEVAVGRRYVALNQIGSGITTTQLPSNTGDGIVYIGNAQTAPTASPSSGAILYASGGALYVYQSNGTNFQIQSGTAVTWASDLSGSSNTNQYVAAISGSGGSGGTVAVGSNIALSWATASTTAIIKQADNTTNSATAATFTVQAANATGTGATGGKLALTSGTGTSAAGNVEIQTGGTARLTVSPTLVTSTLPIVSGSTAAASGQIRLPNLTTISWRNNANNGDVAVLTLDNSNTSILGATVNPTTVQGSSLTLNAQGSGFFVQASGVTRFQVGSGSAIGFGWPVTFGAVGVAAPTNGARLLNTDALWGRNTGNNGDLSLISLNSTNTVTVGDNTSVNTGLILQAYTTTSSSNTINMNLGATTVAQVARDSNQLLYFLMNGGLKVLTRRITGAYTIDSSSANDLEIDCVLTVASTLTLPKCTAGRVIILMDSGVSGVSTFDIFNLTVAPNGSDKIEGINTNKVLSAPGGTWKIVGDSSGTNWKVM